MAVKSSNKTFYKEKGTKANCASVHEQLSDEIALRDEILDLKRQIIILKRTNEYNLVKFRKYEDEAKRKDRQIEQLMDPRKNADITKNLSTKGAAILMNLKDQNNSLIQMVLNKDLQIKRLTAEIKTSKLYATSKKTESYKTEIIRLRNLLNKSEKIIKENLDFQHQTKLYENLKSPVHKIFSSSDSSTPRELEELRFTIQSLENHIKYSNDLLLKKNQEILMLKNQLNDLQKQTKCITCENYFLGKDYQMNISDINKQECPFQKSTPRRSKKVEILHNEQDMERQLEDTMKIINYKKVPNSVPTSSCSKSTFNNTAPKNNSEPYIDESILRIWSKQEKKVQTENEHLKLDSNDCNESEMESIKEIFKSQEILLYNNSGSDKLLHDISHKEKVENFQGIEKWKSVISKLKNFKKDNLQYSQIQKPINIRIKGYDEESNTSDSETNEFEMNEKKIMNEEKYMDPNEINNTKCFNEIQNLKESEKNLQENKINHMKQFSRAINVDNKDNAYDTQTSLIDENNGTYPAKCFDTKKSFEQNTHLKSSRIEGTPKTNCNLKVKEKNVLTLEETCNQKESELKFQNSTEQHITLPDSKKLTSEITESHSNDTSYSSTKADTETNKSIFPREFQEKFSHLFNNTNNYTQMKKDVSSKREIYQQSYDSSFDSENSFSMKQEVQHFQVEVEINSIPKCDKKWENILEDDLFQHVNVKKINDTNEKELMEKEKNLIVEVDVDDYLANYNVVDEDDDDDDDVIIPSIF